MTDAASPLFLQETKANPLILIIDDTLQNVRILELILTREGFQVLTASDGPSGRKLAMTHDVDLILLDIMMPGESGFETCRILKASEKTNPIPIIFVSTMDGSANKVMGLEAGGVDYVTKPFDRAEVLARIRVHIKLGMAYRFLIQRQLNQIHKLGDAQRALLVQPEDYKEGQFAVSYTSLHEAGGDFYDAFSLGEGISGYFVSDISGHDLETSLLISALKALLRSNTGALFTPQETFRIINDIFRQMLKDGHHLTAAYVVLNRHKAKAGVILAGHPPILHIGPDKKARVLGETGDILGAFSEIRHQYVEEPVSKGDRLYLFTDGVIERVHSGQGRLHGIQKLSEALVRHFHLPLALGIQKTMADLNDLPADDDQVLLGVEV